jgi:hypothetical protein
MSTYRLRNLFSPRSVALVGASPRQGSVGRAILGNIHKAKFKGEFWVGEYPMCTENLIRVDEVRESPKLAE